ncbi:phosphoinositide phosphatase SAC3-like isoform X2 [Vicia villosa]|uniref:phosphoinositide phosphatase SAC3-like isoform X2 n=1 Tax=Vicia villosa TaxID=3911 RepID=UPI00273BB7FD|nr:phosphoinositide phosphatase SAC3-like isoform X2 [Vicia villosa]
MASSENYERSHSPSLSDETLPPSNLCMQKFRLYETRSNFYMIGRDKSRAYWRVLKIDRLDPSELNVREDSTTYSERECSDLLRRIHEGNKSTGGLKFVTTCYGIVGFIKLLGPYYMLLITKRRQIGAICGHTVYAISKTEMIPLPNSSVRSNITDSKNENRYKKLLCTVDLTKDFFFSYSYHIMRSLQRNMCGAETGHVLYETMFVWNEFLTRGIRNHLQNTFWTVALVYGFFKQDTLEISGREFILTLIARRSRHYAGTRYLRRGVNDKGRVANDVETEQIVFEDVPEGFPIQISSIIQNRGSIPLFWSQETSRLNIKPDIIRMFPHFMDTLILVISKVSSLSSLIWRVAIHLFAYVIICSFPVSKKDQNYQATRLHFENLVKRYGNPIIILNLIKTHEKKPREAILRQEFANAIDFINKDLSEEDRLRFLHWDLHKHFQSKATNVLLLLSKVAAYALALTGFFYCQASSTLRPEDCPKWPPTDDAVKRSFSPTRKADNDDEDANDLERRPSDEINVSNENGSAKSPRLQRGVLRTNCIDCLDRTNVAQYAYGLAAIGHQLHSLGIVEHPKVDLDDPVANDLMQFYERMGDTLAHQYGGSAAHNKIFSARRGQWRAATQSQEFFRTLQRYYSNAWMDAEKQDAINVFLGHFQPQQGKPALWELGSDQHYDTGRLGDDDARSFFKRSFSDGNFLRDSSTPMSTPNAKNEKTPNPGLPDRSGDGSKAFCESSPEISTPEPECDISFSRYTPSMSGRQLFVDMQKERCAETRHIYYSEHVDSFTCSNFVDLDWLSSSGNSCEEEPYERSSITSSPVAELSSENVVNGVVVGETAASTSDWASSSLKGSEASESEASYRDAQTNNPDEFPDTFVEWVTYGQTLCH